MKKSDAPSTATALTLRKKRRVAASASVFTDPAKEAEIAARRLAAIVQSSEDAIVGKNLQGIVTDWNRGAENIFGYTAEEMIGTSITRLIPPDRLNEEKMILSKIRKGQAVEHFETIRRTKTGRLIDVSVTASPIRDSRGKIVGISKVSRDISERKRSEEVLRRNEALFGALVAQAPLGVFVVDTNLRLLQANPKALPLFRQEAVLLGRSLAQILEVVWPKRVAARLVKRFRHVLKTGEPYQDLDFAERRRDLRTKEHYEWQVQRVTLPAGESGVVCFFSNITERKRAEEMEKRLDLLTLSNRRLNREIQRREAVEKRLKKSEQHQSLLLEQARAMQEQLRNVSRAVLRVQEEERKRISRELHDIIAQTLTGINIRLANLKEASRLEPREFRKAIDSTRRLVEESVNTVHRFARELRPAVLDDLGLTPALHSLMKTLTERTGIRASLTVFAGIEKLDATRRTVLFRVAQEALTNVSRHSGASKVGVSIERLAHGITMKIKDDGRAFDVGRALKGKGAEHLGILGMRERLEMIGGSLVLESSPGEGTTLYAHLPWPRKRSPLSPDTFPPMPPLEVAVGDLSKLAEISGAQTPPFQKP